MNKIIIFLTFSVFIKTENFLKTDEGDDPTKCNREILNEYLPDVSKIPETVQNSTPEMLKICPDLDKTCCNLSDLEHLKTQLLSGRENLLSLLPYHDSLTKNLKSINPEKLENYLNSEEISKLETCLGEDFPEKTQFLSYINKNSEIAREKLEVSINKTIKYYSSFACEFCHSRMQLAIDIENSKAKKIRQNFFDLKTRFQALIYLSDYISYLYQYAFLAKIGLCLKSEETPDFSELRNIYKNLSNIKIGLISCQNKEEYKEECMTVLVLSNAFDRIWSFGFVLKGREDFESGIKSLGEFVDPGFVFEGFGDSFDGKVVFYEKREGGLDFEGALLDVNDVAALEMYHDLMEKDLWGGVEVVGVVFAVFVGFFL